MMREGSARPYGTPSSERFGRASVSSDNELAPRHYVVLLERVLSRPWRCDACSRQIRKSETVVVHVEAGDPPNRVYHRACAPAPVPPVT